MAVSAYIGPKAQHWMLYERRPYRRPGLTIAQILVRLVLIILGAVVLALVWPFIPSLRPNRPVPHTSDEYLAQLIPSFLISVLVAGGVFYQYITKPLRNHRLGYRLVGRFVVLGKGKIFWNTWLELEPEDSHHVRIDPNVFDRFQKGDTVEVVYSATKDLISVHKINGPAARR